MKNSIKNHYQFIVSLSEVKSNVHILAVITFFLMFLSFYNNLIYIGVFYLLLSLAYNLVLLTKPEEKWETSKEKKIKGIKNLLKFLSFIILFGLLSYTLFYFLIFFF